MIDIHVHFFPPAVFRAIWRYFENQSGGLWKINYKLYGDKHVQTLRDQGIKRFSTLVYAHKPGMADFLNEYIRESAAQYPEILPFGTVYVGDPEPAAVARKIFEDYGFMGIKLHPFVTGEMLDDSRFFPVYEIMQDLSKVLVCHPGSGPVYDMRDGAERIRNIMNEFPKLKVVIAHCGAFEYEDYIKLGEDFESVYFDTAMNCVHTHVFDHNCPGREFFVRFQDRILFGTDFPNIPYEYGEQIDSIKKFELGVEIETKIFQVNAAQILELEEPLSPL